MTHEEMIAVIQAYDKGETIQYRHVCKEWNDCTGEPLWDFYHTEYRVKPEPHYRPFKNAEEVIEAIKEHGLILRYKSSPDCHLLISEWSDLKLWIGTMKGKNYDDVFEEYTFADGTPFGKLED